MRVAVAVTYSTETRRFHVFEEDELEFLFEQLSAADLVVGYNIRKFDYRVLSRYAPGSLAALPTLDLMDEIAELAGHRVKLNNLARTTLGSAKGGSGANAPHLFREGLMYELVEYCTQSRMAAQVQSNSTPLGASSSSVHCQGSSVRHQANSVHSDLSRTTPLRGS